MTTSRVNGTAEQDFVRWRECADVQALGRVFDALAPELLIVAAHVAGRGAAEDLVQATFLQAITDGARWDAARPLLPWLVGVLANLAAREREKARRVIDPVRVPLPAGAADPHGEAERHELAQMMGSALQGLPAHYRQVLVLRLVHGLEPAAIAHALGAPPATVKSRLQRGLDLLRRALPHGVRVPAFAAWSAPSLDAVRATVLAHGEVHAGVAAVGTAATAQAGFAVLATTFAGVLLMKKTMLAVVGVAFAAALALSWNALLGAPPSEGSLPSSEPQPAAAAIAATEPAPTAPALDASRTEVEGAKAVSGEAPAAAFAGRVVDEAGQPLADVGVFLGDKRSTYFHDAARFLHSAAANPGRDTIEKQVREDFAAQVQRTGAAGEFQFEAPPNPMPHLLVAWSPERGCRAIDLPAEPTQHIEIVLPQDPVVRGVVRSRADQKPIAGAEVHVWPGQSGMPIAWRLTDANGAYALQPLPPGTYRTLLRADGFAEASPGFTLAADERTHALDAELAPLPAFATLLVDRAGLPWTPARIGEVVGAKVARLDGVLSERTFARRSEMQSSSWRTHRVQVEPDGHVRGAVRDPKAVVFTIWHGPEKLFEVPAFDFTATRLVVEMLPRTTIDLQVHVRCDPPSPVPTRFEFVVVDPSGFGQDETALVTRATADAVCTLPVPSHFAGKECGLVVRGPGYVTSYTVVTVPAQAGSAWQEVVLSPPCCTVRGVVVGPDGQPVPKAGLLVADAEGRWLLPRRVARQTSGLDGSFTIADLPQRRVRVFVWADAFAPRAVELDPRVTDPHRIALQEARTVQVKPPAGVEGVQFRVLDAAGRPLADDRMNGTIRYGAALTVGAEAATIEAFDATTGAKLGSGAVPADGRLVLQ